MKGVPGHVFRRGAPSLSALIGVASVSLFLAGEDSGLLWLGAFLTGAMWAGIWGLAPSCLTERFSTEALGVGPGPFYHVGAAVGSLTPLIVEQIQDTGMTLTGAMRLCIVTSGLMVAGMIWIGPKTCGREFAHSGYRRPGSRGWTHLAPRAGLSRRN